MKKKIALLMTALMMLGITAGCGGSESPASADKPAEVSTLFPFTQNREVTTQQTNTSTYTPNCQNALEGVTLNIGTSGTYAPFSYFSKDGTILQGFDVDFLMELQKVLGFELEGGALQDMDYGPLTDAVTEGQLDVAAAALCATDERKAKMNFSDTYYDAGIIVAVAQDCENITCVEDLLSGAHTVAVQSGTVAYEYACANMPESCLRLFDSQALAYQAVEDGEAEATIYDAPGTAYSITAGEIDLKIVGNEFYNGQAPYAIAFSFDVCERVPGIVDYFNDAIIYLTQNGMMGSLKGTWCE